jgi:hypothetical protein
MPLHNKLLEKVCTKHILCFECPFKLDKNRPTYKLCFLGFKKRC